MKRITVREIGDEIALKTADTKIIEEEMNAEMIEILEIEIREEAIITIEIIEIIMIIAMKEVAKIEVENEAMIIKIGTTESQLEVTETTQKTDGIGEIGIDLTLGRQITTAIIAGVGKEAGAGAEMKIAERFLNRTILLLTRLPLLSNPHL
jgi:hypothetical protein